MGDEGKGKIVDWLSERADVIVRFQGGHNAGHTLVIGGKVYKLSLLPSGIVREGKLSIIGNGVVVDPWALLDEIVRLEGQGVSITPENLRLAENAALIPPLHGELDNIRERAAGRAAIGTTGRGIGPAYEDKVGRRAVRVSDLADEATLDGRIDRALAHHNALRRGLGELEIKAAGLKSALLGLRRAFCRSWIRFGARWMPIAVPATGSCSKAPKGPCWMWIMAPIPMLRPRMCMRPRQAWVQARGRAGLAIF